MNRKTLTPIYLVVAALLLIASPLFAKTLTVVQWNVEWFPGRSATATDEAKQKQMEAAQRILKQLNPDIFCAEEIADWDSFVKLVSVVPKLHAHMVSGYRVGDTIGRQQEAIASCLPANSTWYEQWKKTEANPPRGLAFAALTLPDGKLLLVYAVHLKSNSTAAGGTAQTNRARREDSAVQLAAHVGDIEKVYKSYKLAGIVIAGDFNTNLDSPDWKTEKTIPTLEGAGFYSTWTGVAAQDRLTWKSKGSLPSTTFDWIMTKGLGKPTASMWKTSEDASDHEPVVMKIEIPDKPSR